MRRLYRCRKKTQILLTLRVLHVTWSRCFFICKTSDPMGKRRIGKILLKRKLYVMPRGYLEDQKDDITDGGEGNMFGDFIKTCLTTRHVHMIKLRVKVKESMAYVWTSELYFSNSYGFTFSFEYRRKTHSPGWCGEHQGGVRGWNFYVWIYW